MIQWKNPWNEKPNKSNVPCFIKINNSIQIAYWDNTIKEWTNPAYGLLPRVYDDEGIYSPEVDGWMYMPDELVAELY